MRKIAIGLLAGAGALMASSANASDIYSRSEYTNSDLVQQVRMVCDDSGRCYRSRESRDGEFHCALMRHGALSPVAGLKHDAFTPSVSRTRCSAQHLRSGAPQIRDPGRLAIAYVADDQKRTSRQAVIEAKFTRHQPQQ